MVAEKVFVFNGKLIDITAEQIIVHAEYIGTEFNIYSREFFYDIFAQHWHGQSIVINAGDGEPIWDLGVVHFFVDLCKDFDIPQNLVTFITHDNRDYLGFNKTVKGLEIFWESANYLPGQFRLDPDARFVGATIGRYTPARLRLMYTLANELTQSCFIVNKNSNIEKHIPKHLAHIYSKEIEWAQQYQFDRDLSLENVSWNVGCESYSNVWGKYQIEIVCETHVENNYWFTEKTARCLATGKPFLLLSGAGALATLHNLGFETWGSLIDESYDSLTPWTLRINKIVDTLKTLYANPDRENTIKEMYNIALHNQQLFAKVRHDL